MAVEYVIGDALEEMQKLPDESVSLIHLDDAWARPMRCGGFGVEYDTHAFEETDEHFEDHDTSLTTSALALVYERVLETGGLLVADTDAWLLAKLLDYVSTEWGEHSFAVGNVTLLTQDGTPDRSTPGMYFSNGGYSVLYAWKDACPIDQTALSTPCYRQHEDYGWSSVKPLDPYQRLLDAYCSPGDHVLVPCAGTAPAAVAAELVFGDDVAVTCIDVEEGAKEAYERRRVDELNRQTGLSEY